MFLALCMLLSCVVVVAAEDEEKPVETVTVVSASDEGWDDKGVETEADAPELSISYGSGAKGIGALQINFTAKGYTIPSYDISAMEYLEFDLWLNNAALLSGVGFNYELTSSGTCDLKEDQMGTKPLDTYVEGGALKDGWNHVKIPLSDWPTGGCDRTAMNFIRFFNQDEADFGEEVLEAKLGAPKFTSAAGNVDLAMNEGWNYTYFVDETTRSWSFEAGELGVASFRSMWVAPSADAVLDLSAAKYLDLKMYVSDPAEFKKVRFELELTSSGAPDVEENAWTGYFLDAAKGWNTFRIPMSAIKGSCDLTKVNFIRLFNRQMDNQSLTVLAAPLTIEVMEYEFGTSDIYTVEETVFNAKDSEYILRADAGKNDNQYFADAAKEIVLKFALTNYKEGVRGVWFAANVSAELKIEAATKDNADYDKWTVIYDSEGAGLDLNAVSINLGKALGTGNISTTDEVYIRISDSDTADGWGGSLYFNKPGAGPIDTVLYVEYAGNTPSDEHVRTPEDDELDIIEETGDEHSVPFFGCNVDIDGANGPWQIDYDNKQAGSACATITLGTYLNDLGEEVTTPGQSSFQSKFDGLCGVDTIDTTGMDTLEFDFYISCEPSVWNGLGFADTGLELTSSGTCDKFETCWNFSQLLTPAHIVGGELKTGWNHLEVPLESGQKKDNGGADMTALNYIRFFFVNAQNLPEEPIVVKLDNMRFTDRQAQKIAEETPKATPVIEAIYSKLGTEDAPIVPKFDDESQESVDTFKANLDAWKAICAELDEALEALSDTAKSIVTKDGAKKILTTAQKQITNYEKWLLKNPDGKVPTTDEPIEGGDEPIEGGDEPIEGGDEPIEGGDDPETPEDPETPAKKGNGTVIIIVVVAVVVIAAAVCVYFFVIKKKKA